MKKNMLLLACFILTAFNAQAQRAGFTPGAKFVEQTLMQFPAAVDANNSKQIKGTRFTVPDYCKGELWTSNNLYLKEGYDFKFDEVENTVQIRTEKDNKELLVDVNLIDSFYLHVNDLTTYYYYKAAVPSKQRIKENKIFQVVYVGQKILLFKIPNKVLHHKNYKGAFGDGRTVAEYVSKHDYYVKAGDKPLTKMSLSKKDILNKVAFKRAALEEQFEYIEFYEELTEKRVVDIFKKIEH